MNNREKVGKYSRDVNTERGLRKCLHRDTNQYCDCMPTKHVEAKGMEKTERCKRCHKEIPKKLMKKCDGCEKVVYCGEKCQIQDWPRHKITCERGKKITWPQKQWKIQYTTRQLTRRQYHPHQHHHQKQHRHGVRVRTILLATLLLMPRRRRKNSSERKCVSRFAVRAAFEQESCAAKFLVWG